MNSRTPPIAPVWHTVGVLVLLATPAWLGAILHTGSTQPRIANLFLYLFIMAFEWAIFAFIVWRSDIAFTGYLARVLHRPRALLWDIPIAIALGAFLLLITVPIVHLLGPAGWNTTKGMLPRTMLERVTWILLATTAGICEETIFRGYLQQQLSAWTGSVTAGVIGQGILFGLCHAYQNWKHVILICIWGFVFGLVAWLRKGLRANMIAHAALDILAIFTG